jgi:hypothetical protein
LLRLRLLLLERWPRGERLLRANRHGINASSGTRLDTACADALRAALLLLVVTITAVVRRPLRQAAQVAHQGVNLRARILGVDERRLVVRVLMLLLVLLLLLLRAAPRLRRAAHARPRVWRRHAA